MRIASIIWAFLLLCLLPSAARADACAPVEREMTYGEVALKRAKNQADYLKSAKEFEAATKKAPTCAAAHFNLGVVLEKAGQYEAALKALNRYLDLMPAAKDAAAVRKKTYELEYLAREAGAKATAGSGGLSAALEGWLSFSGKWCVVSACDHPQGDFEVSFNGAKIVIQHKYRFRRGSYASDRYAVYQGTVSAEGKVRGFYTEGTTMVTNPQCRGRPMEDRVAFEGDLKKDTVIDPKGRAITGGAIILRARVWGGHNYNYDRCTLDRDPTLNWSAKTVILKRRN